MVVDTYCCCVVERTAKGCWVEWISNFNRGVGLDELANEGIKVFFMDEQATESSTALSAGTYCCEGASLKGKF